MGSLKRLASGDSFFMSTYKAEGDAEVVIAPTMPGDVKVIELDGSSRWMCAGASYMASGPDVSLDTKFQGMKGLFSGESLFYVELSGKGPAVVNAFGLIRESGEVEPRVSEIVQRAGISNQAFYKHFRSKHELLVAVLDQGIRTLAGYLTHRMERATSPSEAVREWLRGMAEQALDPAAARATRPFALARGRLSESHPEEIARSEQQLTAPLRDALERAVAAGELPGADPERDAEALYHLAMGWMQTRLLDASRARRADAEQLEAFAMAGLARPLPSPRTGGKGQPQAGRAGRAAQPADNPRTSQPQAGRAGRAPRQRGALPNSGVTDDNPQ